MTERWNWDTKPPWKKAFLRITPEVIDDLLGRRVDLRVVFNPEQADLLIKVYGPDLPDKYITQEGHEIQEIGWEEFREAMAPIPR